MSEEPFNPDRLQYPNGIDQPTENAKHFEQGRSAAETDTDKTEDADSSEAVHAADDVVTPTEPDNTFETSGRDGKGPENKRPLLGVALACVVVLLAAIIASSLICRHEEWIPATCEEPKTCAKCGATEGEPLGHDWIPATCSEPKTCSRCGETEGESLGHTPGEWSEAAIDIANAEQASTLTCTKCGEVIDSRATPITSFISNGQFIFSPSDFCARLRKLWGMEAIDGGNEELISYAMVEDISNPEMVAMLSFSSMDGQTNLPEEYKYNSTCNPSPILLADTTKCDSAEAFIALAQACDPSLSRRDAVDIAMEMAENIQGVSGSATRNGLEYKMAGIDERILFRVTII